MIAHDDKNIQNMINNYFSNHPDIIQIIIDFIDKYPELQSTIPDVLKTYFKLINCFDSGNKLFICGNGGSHADAMHIAGELMKSFLRDRKLKSHDKSAFDGLDYGKELSNALEYGLPVIVLGLNHALFTATENDNITRYIGFAQELYSLAKKGDVLIGISTSGNAKNVLYAIDTAKAKQMVTVGLTGVNEGKLSKIVDIAIKVPDKKTNSIQEYHLPVYHLLCAIVEAHYFKEER